MKSFLSLLIAFILNRAAFSQGLVSRLDTGSINGVSYKIIFPDK